MAFFSLFYHLYDTLKLKIIRYNLFINQDNKLEFRKTSEITSKPLHLKFKKRKCLAGFFKLYQTGTFYVFPAEQPFMYEFFLPPPLLLN